MKRSLITLLLLAHFLKEIVWIGLVPLWHFPDEQSHVAQVAYIAEKGLERAYGELDLTEEIRRSEELLGTERDEMGVNKFTYHPEFRIEYTDTTVGLYEEEIQNLAVDSQNRGMVKQEASRYPPLYYTMLAGVYRVFYQQDIFIRVFSMRLVQMLFSLGTVYFSYLIGTLIFNSRRLGVFTAALVSFHPMFSFVSAGVNSDNIGTFLFTAYIFFVIKLLYHKNTALQWMLYLLLTVLTVTQKPQFIILAPVTVLMIFLQVWRMAHTAKRRILSVGIMLMAVILGIQLAIVFRFSSVPLIASFFERMDVAALFSYVKDYMIRHLYREVLPWYWGVYDWLGVTYPRVVHRTINWLGVAAGVGLLVGFLRGNRQVRERILILASFSGLLVAGIYGYDWLEWSQRNIHLGVQGRYFFPAISAHMGLMLLGLISLVPRRFQQVMGFVLVVAMMVLNWYALYTVAATYYDLSSLSSFLNQASQYKPWFFKGGHLLIWLAGYIIALVLLFYLLLREHFQNLNSHPGLSRIGTK